MEAGSSRLSSLAVFAILASVGCNDDVPSMASTTETSAEATTGDPSAETSASSSSEDAETSDTMDPTVSG